MTRVAFVMASLGQGWLGGLSYFRNLFAALRELEAPALTPVIITRPQTETRQLESFQPIEVLYSSLVDTQTPWWKLRRASQLYLDRDVLFERFLKRNRIDLLSHSGYLGRNCAVPAMPWIADFQELHFPGFFSAAELAARRDNLQQSCRHANAILLSSQAALDDLAHASAGCATRARVLPFVASVPRLDALPTLHELEQRYAFNGPFFHLPNQFWAHKNHEVVIDALQRLLALDRRVLVLATGNTEDHRQPDHYPKLQERVVRAGVQTLFRVLGVVPYPDLMGLMAHSVAVINPSLFEGWSTTVEEGKSLGKQVILSDIPVHREQAPERGTYFDPGNADALAGCLWDAQSRYAVDADRIAIARAAENLPRRRKQFARRYQQIVADVIALRSAR
jgi:glycosyltransferase involved in cell wall biosynthesis